MTADSETLAVAAYRYSMNSSAPADPASPTSPSEAVADAPESVTTPLTIPQDGVPDLVDTPAAYARVVAAFRAGTGPVAVDAERASGYRYGQRTYLVQLRRAGAGTALIDPVAIPDMSELSAALDGTEWVLHAASQDLPGLKEQKLFASSVFDTELAARLLNLDRVGLAAVVAEVLGLGLAKEHSAVDWSTRPIPEPWLLYAALDVEVLVELRDRLEERLIASGKLDWAHQEFEAVRLAPPAQPREEPWRRVSGLKDVRSPRQLAVVRELWLARDENGRKRDIAPGRVLPDRAIVAAAKALPRSIPALTSLPTFAGRTAGRRAPLWQAAIDRALAQPEDQLPSTRGPRTDGPPPPRAWKERHPAAAARLDAARSVVAELSETHSVPVENLLQPDALRRLCWQEPAVVTADEISEFLASRGARPWQRELISGKLAFAFAQQPATVGTTLDDAPTASDRAIGS